MIAPRLGTSRLVCIEQDDEQELWTKTKASLVLSIKTTPITENNTILSVDDAQGEFYESLIQDIILELTKNIENFTSHVLVSRLSPDWTAIQANVTLKSSINEPIEHDIPISRNLLQILEKFIDCGDSCLKYKDSRHNTTHTSRFSRLPTSSALNSFVASGLVLYQVQVGLFTPDSEISGDLCLLCEGIKLITSTPPTTTKTKLLLIWKESKRLAQSFIQLLEPMSWFYLILSIWLTCCLIIAIRVKRRDRRHLHLYLEERADYSFSAKR